MIEAQTQIAHGPDRELVADRDDALAYAVGREDPHLWLVDDRHRDLGPVATRVGDRERSAGRVVGGEALRARSSREVVDRSREGPQAQAIGTVHDGDDEPLVIEVDGDSEPDVAVHRGAVTDDRRVEQREVAQRVDDGTRDERQVREREALRGAELLAPGATRDVDRGVVDRDDRERVRGSSLRREQRDAGALLHPVERDPLVTRRYRRAGRNVSVVGPLDVGERRAPAGPRAGTCRERSRVDAARCGGAANGRREEAGDRPGRSYSPRQRRGRSRDGAGRHVGHGPSVRRRILNHRPEVSDVKVLKRRSLPSGVPVDEALDDFRLALVSRYLDDREIALRQQSKVFFQISGAGHEALLLGLARSLRPAYDWFFPYYRDRALALALGVTPTEMLLEAVGAANDPASGGRQMPCHWGARHLNIVSQTSCTGSQCLPAIGCAEATRYIGRRDLPGCTAHGDEITYVSLGEGATSEGEFWESLNTACRLHLPVLYIVADNGYAISVRAADQAPAPISEMVAGIRGLHIVRVDGRDYFEVRREGADAIAHARAGIGPVLIHATVTRPYAHSLSDDQKKYRDSEELRDEAEHDPLVLMEQALLTAEVVDAAGIETLKREAREEVRLAGEAALAAPRPDPASVVEHVFAPAAITDDPGEPPSEGEAVAFGEAIRLTLHEEMERDERIRVFGEDVADCDPALLDVVTGKGGVFGITFGLQRRFGNARCFNTPLAEANIIGRAGGMAIRGLHPCPEIQFFDYIWPAMQQLKSEVATVRWRSNGEFSCPMVVRVAIGGYLTGGAIWHSHCDESIFAHVPGLLIAFPSRARDAVGLLRTAFRTEDPVLFLEHKHLYRQGYNRDPMPPEGWMLPFGRGAYVTRGTKATVVTWGATVHRTALAAQQLGPDHGVEIVDLRTITPWDHDIVAESVRRTGRLLVVHEDRLTGGFGAEIAAFAADACFEHLDAPVLRLAAADTLIGYEPTLEAATLPQVDDIARDLATLIAY